VPPSGQLEKHGENKRKQKKTILLPDGSEQKKTLFPDKGKSRNMFFICFCLFLSVFSSSAPLERFPVKT
jgi:hypothetical protein